MKIKRSEIIGFTKAPDGKCYLNLKNFKQVEVVSSMWLKLRSEALN
jgi:hypothetical protein